MQITRRKLYLIILIACTAGYSWLIFEYNSNRSVNECIELCFIKKLTTIPCPSCGSTRSVLSIIHGNFKQAIGINPLGILIAAIMLVAPVWVLVDLLLKKASFFNLYLKIEFYIKKRIIAIPLILLMVANWIWNIYKGI